MYSMRIPFDSIIAEEKFTGYLLVKRDFDDKSQYLAKAGYTAENYLTLINDIKFLISENDAVEERNDDYGTFYRVSGTLPGTGSTTIDVATIWMRRKIDNKFQFITLIPVRRK